MKKGFALDDERLKNLGGGNCFPFYSLNKYRIWEVYNND